MRVGGIGKPSNLAESLALHFYDRSRPPTRPDVFDQIYADAQAICTDDRMRQKLSSVSAGGKSLCDDIAIIRVRLARPEEKVKYLEETAARAHETGLVVVYLVKLDRAPAY
jgi:hypothetical protein